MESLIRAINLLVFVFFGIPVMAVTFLLLSSGSTEGLVLGLGLLCCLVLHNHRHREDSADARFEQRKQHWRSVQYWEGVERGEIAPDDNAPPRPQ